MAWQSSKVPSSAMLCTFGSAADVIWRRWTSLTLPLGCRMKMSIASSPRKASIAAAPVSPEVAPITVAWAPLHHLHGEVLEGERRAVKQLEQEAVRPDLAERRHSRVVKGAICLFQNLLEVGKAGIILKEGADDAVGGIGIVEAGERRDLAGRKARPGLRHQEPAVARHGGKERALERERRRLAARRDEPHL